MDMTVPLPSVGDKRRAVLEGFERVKDETYPVAVTGTVSWVHPEGRYYVVDFPVWGQTIRECFHPYD